MLGGQSELARRRARAIADVFVADRTLHRNWWHDLDAVAAVMPFAPADRAGLRLVLQTTRRRAPILELFTVLR
jgi:hypothetical protein